MKLTIILSTKKAETNWNAFRLANYSLDQGDEVSIFLINEGVEYENGSSEKFDIKREVKKFLEAEASQILACTTCIKIHDQEGSETCPTNSFRDLYTLIKESDRVITF